MYSNVPKIDLTVVEVTGIFIFCKIRIELGKKAFDYLYYLDLL